MLYFMRKKAKHFGFLLFGIIIIAFVFWVPGGFDNDNSGQGNVAKVGEMKISLLDFWTIFDNAEQKNKARTGESLDTEARERLKLDVLAGLIYEAAILQVAEDEGISVSNKEVEAAIKSEQVFWREGKFDYQLYLALLRQNRMDRNYYENARRKELIKDKVLSLADSVVSLSPEDEKALESISKKDKTFDIENAKAQFLAAKQDNVRISFSEGLKSEFYTTYDLELLKSE